ncbi:MAG: GNAT family N-acetyltransferase [Clostridia bacterium]|nr:GNAT family N-acetyltransferase [Clostridia bacterium]
MPAKPESIRTERLLLRAVEEGDREDMFRVFSNNCVKKTYMLPDFDSVEAMEKLFQRFIALSGNPERFVYGIALDGRLIGFMNETKKDENSIEMGYVIYPDWQKQGYMTEAFAAAIGALFKMGYRSVTAGFFEGNAASRRVMEKCGMTPTGETEDIEYRGETRKCILYEIKAG